MATELMQHLYRYIEDGQIIGGPKALPTNWRDKGDLNTMTSEQQRDEGWFPNYVNDQRQPGEVDAGWTDEILPNRVIQTLHSQPAPVVVPVVPEVVTMRQARLALFGAGLLSAVDAAIDALPSPMKEAARIEWEYSQEVHRDKALVQTLGPALGLTEAQMDALFITAESL